MWEDNGRGGIITCVTVPQSTSSFAQEYNVLPRADPLDSTFSPDWLEFRNKILIRVSGIVKLKPSIGRIRKFFDLRDLSSLSSSKNIIYSFSFIKEKKSLQLGHFIGC